MLSLSSLAFILASAIRRARALSSAALHCSADKISGRKMATKMATKTPVKMAIRTAAVSMSVSYEQFTPDGTSRRCPAQEYNQSRFRTLPHRADSIVFPAGNAVFRATSEKDRRALPVGGVPTLQSSVNTAAKDSNLSGLRLSSRG